MKIRRAAETDQPLLRELWEEFQLEVPEPEHFVPETWDEEWGDMQKNLETGAVFLAEDDGGTVGVARLEESHQGSSHIHLVYVRPRARREGVTKALLRACAEVAREQGSKTVSLEVQIGRAHV